MYYPSLKDARALAGSGNLIPIYREILADLETPVSAYLKIAEGSNSFLLESVEGGERLARYSFIGTNPYLVVILGDGVATLTRPDGEREEQPFSDPLALIAEQMAHLKPVRVNGLPRFHGGAVGYLSYETVRHFEDLPSARHDPLGLPKGVFSFADTLLVFDHLKHKIKVVSHARLNGDLEKAYYAAVERIEKLIDRLEKGAPRHIASREGQYQEVEGLLGPTSNMTKSEFEEMVRRGKEYIRAGDIIQVVLSQRMSKRTAAHPFNIYRKLRTINPSPYMYFLETEACSIAGASPEMLVRVEEDEITTRPIAGTRPRGRNEAEEEHMEQELRASEKERAEHIMLVDLGRNDLGRVCQAGTVKVSRLMDIERYSHVMHLVSNVTGALSPTLSGYDALRCCFPAGTVSGAPKIRAMEVIAELERDERGPYAGAVGYMSFSGNLDTAITIRTVVVADGVAHIQAGAGIVADSEPEAEYYETLNKARPVLHAIQEAELL